MFKNITINLTAPICKCRVQKLSWTIYKDEKQNSCLSISCETCKTQLKIPYEQFLGHFALDNPYPGPEPPKENLSAKTGYDDKFLKNLHIKTDETAAS